MMPLPTGDLVIDKIIREAKETELPVVVTTPDECLVDYIKMNWVTEVYHYAEDRNGGTGTPSCAGEQKEHMTY